MTTDIAPWGKEHTCFLAHDHSLSPFVARVHFRQTCSDIKNAINPMFRKTYIILN